MVLRFELDCNMKIGDRIKYKRFHDSISFTKFGYTCDEGYDIVDAIYMGIPSKRKYEDFRGSEIVVKQVRSGWIVGIDKRQIIEVLTSQ